MWVNQQQHCIFCFRVAGKMSHTNHGITAIVTPTTYRNDSLAYHPRIQVVHLEFNKVSKTMPSIFHHIHFTDTKICFRVFLDLVHIVRSDGFKLQLRNGRRVTTGLLISVKWTPASDLVSQHSWPCRWKYLLTFDKDPWTRSKILSARDDWIPKEYILTTD